jgi:hypothetical protein
MASRRRGIVSRRAALVDLAATAASVSAFAEPAAGAATAENAAGPVFSPSGPNAELYGAAQGFPIADHALPVQPGEPHKLSIASALTAILMRSIRRIGSSAPPHHGFSSGRRRTFAITIGAIARPYWTICRAIPSLAC